VRTRAQKATRAHAVEAVAAVDLVAGVVRAPMRRKPSAQHEWVGRLKKGAAVRALAAKRSASKKSP
jgi:hypothetical protein